MKLFISPHSDDAVLFGAFTLMAEKPLVLTVTSSYIQSNRGENITADMRWKEDIEAMKVLGCSLMFGGIRDDIIDEWSVQQLLARFYNLETIYAPAIQGGNKDHDLIGKVAKERFGNKCIHYSTYKAGEWFSKGTKEVIGDHKLKDKALACYKSQLNLDATRGHFNAVKGQSEWFI